MSGPTTVIFGADPVSVLLSAAAIRAAEAIQQGYAHAAQLHEQYAAARDATRAMQAAAEQQGREALEHEARAAETRLNQLIALAEQLGASERVRATRPVRPEADDPMIGAAYIRGLQMFSDELQAILLTEAARREDDFTDQAPEINLPAGAAAAVPQRVSRRLLARIAHLGAPPEDIEHLACELDAALPGERAELLTTELRRRIQLHAESLQHRLVQEATSLIVAQSLKDLGYQVEEVADTLFVENGVVHFRRPGWDDYMVRMRVDAGARSGNFNVIRAVDSEGHEVSVLDHLAEDRWCAEFPALLKTLEARGVHLKVTRQLAAGELPVQAVARDKLPEFAEEDEAVPASRLRARELK